MRSTLLAALCALPTAVAQDAPSPCDALRELLGRDAVLPRPYSFDRAAELRRELPPLADACDDSRRAKTAWRALALAEASMLRRDAAFAAAVSEGSPAERESTARRLGGPELDVIARKLLREWNDPFAEDLPEEPERPKPLPGSDVWRALHADIVGDWLLRTHRYDWLLALEESYETTPECAFSLRPQRKRYRTARALWGLDRRQEALEALGDPWINESSGLLHEPSLALLAEYARLTGTTEGLLEGLDQPAAPSSEHGTSRRRLAFPDRMRLEVELDAVVAEGGVDALLAVAFAAPPDLAESSPPVEALHVFGAELRAARALELALEDGAVARAAIARAAADAGDGPRAEALLIAVAFPRSPQVEAALRALAAGGDALAPVAARVLDDAGWTLWARIATSDSLGRVVRVR